MSASLGLALRIEALRERVRRNSPRHSDPEAFHDEKSEIADELNRIARELRSLDSRAPQCGTDQGDARATAQVLAAPHVFLQPVPR